MTDLLRVENLHLAFGSHPAVRDLSFAVDRGETLALVGESGSGKSATALAILRLIEREGGAIAAGKIWLGDTELTALDEPALRGIRGNRVAMVFQEPMTALNPVISLGEQVMEVLRQHQHLSEPQAKAAAIEALARVKIPDPARRLRQFPHELSGGLRQRVMIAMALACQPDLLICDEPTTALDVTTQAEILALIKSLQADLGMGVLFITHDMGVVAEIADRVIVLRQGVCEEQGPVARIFAEPAAAYTRLLMAATPKLGSGAPRPLRDPTPVLRAENLSVRFPVRRGVLSGGALDYHAVSRVSLTIGRGETLGLVGESGCGKSTLARAVLRLIEPDRGHITIADREITGLSPLQLRHERQHAQIIFQDPYASLNPRLPVLDLITEPALIHGRVTQGGRRQLACALLAKVGLEPEAADRFAHQFSGGQRQRLCIARALSVQPSLIVADEAVSALDVSIARQITDLMAQLQRDEGLSFLFISHDIAVVERVSHRIAVMFAGQIVETGPTDLVLRTPRHPYTRRLLSAVPVPDPARRGRPRPASLSIAPPNLVFPVGHQPAHMPLVEVSPGHFVAETAHGVPLPPTDMTPPPPDTAPVRAASPRMETQT
ncbi:ABC transporter ATP-binding protein [Rhizobium sp. SL86]|uniref:ABC transporter ATP-binding protein n=1 Tax=Rhizobium sp. SL86 TaxID=2995148 RepID=UPI002273149A|nr:ABC transporter ATP-binding protein [Rhizobium sp. SL86]MCY1665313.1 ABC transporter ATP-binding protein [Rhizobium sp. SL86]